MLKHVTVFTLVTIVGGCSSYESSGDTSKSDSISAYENAPIAVFEDEGLAVLEEAIGTGTLLGFDNCVYLLDENSGETTILAWPSAFTAWEPSTNTIVFTAIEKAPIELKEGQRVRVGGGETSENSDWLKSPSSSCPSASMSSVYSIAILE